MSDIGDIIRKIANQPSANETFPAIVTAHSDSETSDNKKHTVTVAKLIDPTKYDALQDKLGSSYSTSLTKKETKEETIKAIEYGDVQLKAATNGIDEGIILVPKIGSWVLITLLESKGGGAFISQYSEIDKIIFRTQQKGKEGEEDQWLDVQTTASGIDIQFNEQLVTQLTPEKFDVHFIEDDTTQVHITPEAFTLAKDMTKVEVSEEGVLIEKESQNLAEVLSSFIDEVAKIVVTQGTSPNVAKLQEIKKNLKTILK